MCKLQGEEVIVRYTNGKEASVNRACVKVSKSKSPIDAWPDDFIFFERVLGMKFPCLK
jgi:hypothetical protein